MNAAKFPGIQFFGVEGAAPAMRASRTLPDGSSALEIWELVSDETGETIWRISEVSRVEGSEGEEIASLDVSSFETACHSVMKGSFANAEELRELFKDELREDDETFTAHDGALIIRNSSEILRHLLANAGFYTPKGYAFVNQSVDFDLCFMSDFRIDRKDVSFYLLKVRALADCEMYPGEALEVEDSECENIVHYIFPYLSDAKKAFAKGIADAATLIQEL